MQIRHELSFEEVIRDEDERAVQHFRTFPKLSQNILRKKGLKMVKFINKQNPSTTGQWR